MIHAVMRCLENAGSLDFLVGEIFFANSSSTHGSAVNGEEQDLPNDRAKWTLVQKDG